MMFFETSAKDRINVDNAFQAIVERTLEKINNQKINIYEENSGVKMGGSKYAQTLESAHKSEKNKKKSCC